jgi:hypothetical protein
MIFIDIIIIIIIIIYLGKLGQSHKFTIGMNGPRDDHGDFNAIYDLTKLYNYLKSTTTATTMRRKSGGGSGGSTAPQTSATTAMAKRGGGYAFKVKVLVEEVFIPSVVPANYNSKLTTGMVGLENLGATCYLNALLQVME